jgi:hypothetical protein
MMSNNRRIKASIINAEGSAACTALKATEYKTPVIFGAVIKVAPIIKYVYLRSLYLKCSLL